MGLKVYSYVIYFNLIIHALVKGEHVVGPPTCPAMVNALSAVTDKYYLSVRVNDLLRVTD